MLKAGDVIHQKSSGEDYMIVVKGVLYNNPTHAYFLKDGLLWCEFEVKNSSDITKEEFEAQYPCDSWTHLDGSPLFVEQTYKVGDRFIFNATGDEYILANVGLNCYSLINLRTGGFRNNSIHVVDRNAITESEFAQLTGYMKDLHKFKKVV